MQWEEQAGLEEHKRADILAQIVLDLMNHYDVIWIAASRDVKTPIIFIGTEKIIGTPKDLPLETFASDWVMFWADQFKSELDIWIIPANNFWYKQEWEVLVDKQNGIHRTFDWMVTYFFKDNPFDENGHEAPHSGLEEQNLKLMEAA